MRFEVHGIPQPGGSKRAFINPHTGRPIIVEDNAKSKDWRNLVAIEAGIAMRGQPIMAGPIDLCIEFYRSRPKAHYIGGERCNGLKNKAPRFPTTKPDATKLLRSTEDALKGIVWVDDSQVVNQKVVKRYSEDGAMAIISVDEI